MKKRKIILLAIMALVIGGLVTIKVTNTQVVFIGLLSSNTLFKIDGNPCELAEGRIYLANTIASYREIYGEELFKQNFGNLSPERFLKENVVARLSKIKVMVNLAEKNGISLTEQEKKQASEAAKAYLKELGAEKAQELGADEKLLTKMYREYALAKKAFTIFTEGEKLEVSEDEARVIVVFHMFFQAYGKDAEGKITPFSGEQKGQVYSRAQEALGQLEAGADFANLAAACSDDPQWEYTIGRGEMPEEFDAVAFELEAGERSQIVETPYGYHIILCISDFEERETRLNKARLLKEKQNQRFTELYENYVEKLQVEVNEEKWDKVTIEDMEALDTGSFFAVYRQIWEEEKTTEEAERTIQNIFSDNPGRS